MRADYLTRFTQENPEPLAERPICTRLPASLDEKVKALPNRGELIRQWIIEGYQGHEETFVNEGLEVLKAAGYSSVSQFLEELGRGNATIVHPRHADKLE